MNDDDVLTLNDVIYILELRKNLTSLSTQHANGFCYKSDWEKHIMKVRRSALKFMRENGDILTHCKKILERINARMTMKLSPKFII